MRAITATAIVRPDHTLIVQVPADLPPGVHEVVIVLQEDVPQAPPQPFFPGAPPHDVGLVDPTMTFRREDLYGDDGR